MTTPEVVLLELPDEAEAYVAECHRSGADPSLATVISLNPSVRVRLNQLGVAHTASLDYFTPEANARALNRSDELWHWLEDRFQIEDGLGIQVAYSNSLTWHSRWFLNHLLWLAEVIAEVASKHPTAKIRALSQRPAGTGNPLLPTEERYLGWLAEEFNSDQGSDFQTIDTDGKVKTGSGSGDSAGWASGVAYRIGAELHRRALKRMGHHKPILSVISFNQLERLMQIQADTPHGLPWTVRGGLPTKSDVPQILRKGLKAVIGPGKGSRQSAFLGDIWFKVLGYATKDDPAFERRLAPALGELTEKIRSERKLFSHRGVYFGEQLANKVQNAFGPELSRLNKEIRVWNEVLNLIKPRFIVTTIGRRAEHALGELASRRGIPGLLISHGTFVPIKNDLERKAWEHHSFGLLHGSYSHSALQTPLAAEFAREQPTSTTFVPTGPLAWGRMTERSADDRVKLALLNGRPHSRVIVHAGTPKFRSGTHFHIFELPDEYIAGIRDLIAAVEQTDDAFLIIKYRPAQISVEELKGLLPKSDRFCISVDEPFLDVLGFSDLLVSFSSTTIEEALQNQVPVLLYGGGGRYQHLVAQEVVPGQPVEKGPVFWAKGPEELADGLQRVLDVNGPAPLPAEMFSPYIYKPEEITPFPELVDQLVSCQAEQSPKRRTHGGDLK